MLEDYTRYRIGRRNTMGWCMMGLVVLSLISCVLTMLSTADFVAFFMYGFATLLWLFMAIW
jgi:hypothetical protein